MDFEEIINSTNTIENEFLSMRSQVEEKQILSLEDLLSAGDLLKKIKLFIKKVEEVRTGFVKPINDTVKKINEVFKPKVDMAEEVRRLLEAKMSKYNMEQEKIRRAEEEARRAEEKRKLEEEQKRLEEKAFIFNSQEKLEKAIEIEKKKDVLETAPIEKPKAIKTDTTTTSFRTVWDFEIQSNDEIPRAFCSPDVAKIRDAIKNGVRTIPGVKIFEKQIINSR